MEWYFRNDQPIYTQLTQQITLAILSGSIPSGGRLPTVRELAAVAKKHNITKTALVLVGDVISNQHYTRSRLYAPDFTTEFRKANPQNTVENEGVMCNIHAGKELPE